MKRFAGILFLLSLASFAFAQDVVEPRSGTKFPAKDSGMSLLGAALRTKSIVKVYAIGLYAADSALSGPLKGKAGTPELYKAILEGDFNKKVVMKFVRNLSANQIRDAFREGLKGVDGNAEKWIGYFGDVQSGNEFVIAWTPGVGLQTKVAGTEKPVINDKAFAAAVFGIWLGAKPIQENVKKDLVSRAGELLK